MRTRLLVVGLGVVLLTAGCAGVIDAGTAPSSPGSPTATPTPVTSTTPTGTLDVHYINVGQSVATLVITPANETLLIDSGHWQDDGELVITYLERHGIQRLDYLVSSHGDADHIGGNAAVIDYFETEGDGVGAIYDPGIPASTATYTDYLDAVERHDVTLYQAQAGDSIPLEDVSAEILAPPASSLASGDRNENSLVLHVEFGQTSFLFTGDAGERGEADLVERYGAELNTTVLKAGHHGSKTSTSGRLLDVATPQVVVVSSAYDSPYGHPHEEVLQRLSERGIPTYWTATHGNVVLVSDGEDVTVATQQPAPTTAHQIRDSAPIEPGTTAPVEERTRLPAGRGDPTVTPTATAGGTTPPAAGHLALAGIHADAEGDDRENVNDEYLVFENTGDATMELGGWAVADDADHSYTFPEDFELAPGETVTLYTGSGPDSESELYWGSGHPIWNNAGDTVIVTNAAGELVMEASY